ncbi:hypothetical protein GCM10011495_11610 [Hymenobacter frigidus]|uniref:FtsX-like permease family protein n=1 Tax=Hymenobacter frigidus TaxID=1524095 RepID=A0ABQ2A1U2_9BACT|nr:ABC transporter permease [Hymenobacter frigidus]GGH82815.1 hypothetical protein GCM10011495_11610 [Hymenobacter frigidus]
MLRHLFTLIWNRKRANALLIAEIFFAFVVLFVLGSLLVDSYRRYTMPLGYQYEQVWYVAMDPGNEPAARQDATFLRVIRSLKALPGVRSVSTTLYNTPFSFSDSSGDIKVNGRNANCDRYAGGDDMADVLQLQLAEGRWFDRRDDAATRKPVVISSETRAALFPAGPALGQIITSTNTTDGEMQVVGVLATTYRSRGEFQKPKPAYFRRSQPLLADADTTHLDKPLLLVRVQPTATAELEQRMTKEIAAVSGGWKAAVTTLPEERTIRMKFALAPMGAMGLVGLFLIINVALGLFGVLWQTINQRRAEIGVRRAMGATAGRISAQILGETLVVTTFGLGLGLVVAAQFPLLGVMDMKTGVYLTAMLLATGLIYALTTLCALYPSRLAAGIHPAVALREE